MNSLRKNETKLDVVRLKVVLTKLKLGVVQYLDTFLKPISYTKENIGTIPLWRPRVHNLYWA